MKTIILANALKWLVPVFILFSIYILFRGHNHPGGGFIGGLICSIPFIFHVMVHGTEKTRSDFFTIVLYRFPRLAGQWRAHYLVQLILIQIKRKSKAPDESEWFQHFIKIEPVLILATGLLLAAASGLFSIVAGLPYMTALWTDLYIPVMGKPGTPILFDTGVYLLVLGIVLKITFAMADE